MCRLERARRQELRLGPELRVRVQERQELLLGLMLRVRLVLGLVRQVLGLGLGLGLPEERPPLGTPGPRGPGNLPGGD